MGDGGFQQIIIIGLFLLFGLADLIARFARGRMRSQSQQPGEPVRRPVEEDAPWQVDMPWRDEDDDVVEQRPVRVERPAPMPTRERVTAERAGVDRAGVDRAGAERVSAERGRAPRDRAMRDRTSSVRQAVVRSAPVRPVASRLASGGISARDRLAAGASGVRARGLTFTANDARRGVIAMTVLGPCRALEDPARGV